MGYYIAIPAAPDQSIYAVIQQISEDGRPSYVWDEMNGQWSSFVEFPLFANDGRIALSEQLSSGVLEHAYEGETTSDLGTYTGWIMIHIYNDTLDNYDWHIAYVSQGVSSTPATEWAGADIVEGLANAQEQTIRVRVRKYSNPNTPATGSVVTSRKGYPAGSMSSTANAATYTGVPGIYRVTLTSSETDVEADMRDELFVEVVTSDGVGSVYLNFSQSALEDDFAVDGTLRTQMQTIEDYADQIRADIAYEQSTLWPAAPTLLGIKNTVLNATAADHVAVGSVGELIKRLEILAAGGAGELTTVRANKLDFLDQAVSGNASASDVGTQTLAALVSLGLDHLFTATYDPTSKPGVPDSLLNVLVEADGAVPRFTTNALEQAGGGSGGDDAATIATAVWANATGVTLAANVSSILADTDEIQTTLDAGGSINTVINNRASQASVDALQNLSAADIDARLAAHFTASVNPAITNVRDDITALEAHGDGAWATATGFSTHDPAAVRSELDSNSVQLAAIVADTNEMQVSLANGGAIETRFDTLDTAIAGVITTGNSAWATATGFSTHSAADVRTEVDSNSTQLAAILANTDATDTTLSSGGEIHTTLENITPGAPSVFSADIVNKARTWVAHEEHATARNVITTSEGDVATYAMDFTFILNPDTGVNAANAVVRVEGDDDLTFGTPTVAKDNRHIHVQITGQLAGKEYRIQVSADTTDGQTISAQGRLQVRG